MQRTGQHSDGSKLCWVGEGTGGAAHRAVEWGQQIGLSGEGTVVAAQRAAEWGQQIGLRGGRDGWCSAPDNIVRGANWVRWGKGRLVHRTGQ